MTKLSENTTSAIYSTMIDEFSRGVPHADAIADAVTALAGIGIEIFGAKRTEALLLGIAMDVRAIARQMQRECGVNASRANH